MFLCWVHAGFMLGSCFCARFMVGSCWVHVFVLGHVIVTVTVGPVTVGHVPRQISRFVLFFLQVSEIVLHTKKPSPIPTGGLDIKLLLNFTHLLGEVLGLSYKHNFHDQKK